MANCCRGKPCGKACIPMERTCRKDNPNTTRRRKAPGARGGEKKCNAGISKKCGKACISVRRACKKPGFESDAGPPVRSREETPADARSRIQAAIKAARDWATFVEENSATTGDVQTTGVI